MTGEYPFKRQDRGTGSPPFRLICSKGENAIPFIPTPNCCELVPNFLYNTSNAVVKNVMCIRDLTGDFTLGRLQQLTDLYQTFWQVDLRTRASTGCLLTNIYARAIHTQSGAVWDDLISPPSAGTVSSALLPAHTTFCIKLTTGFAGRSYRGRLYQVGLSEGQVTGDNVSQALADGLVADYTEWAEVYLPPANFEWVVLSKYNNGVARSQGVATTITGISYTDLRVDTQRRRLTGVGQ